MPVLLRSPLAFDGMEKGSLNEDGYRGKEDNQREEGQPDSNGAEALGQAPGPASRGG
jgi:hypothetical protein